MSSFRLIVLVCVLPFVLSASARILYALDENWICNVKRSCLDCLKLSQCSWCETENTCFSKKLPRFEEICKGYNYTDYTNYGLSFLDNAKCACAGGKLEEDCYPPGVTSGPPCTNRGQCICGRCSCDSTMVDKPHKNKMVVGEYCEYDNFSCDGPRCNEGPYLFNDANNIENSTSIQPDE